MPISEFNTEYDATIDDTDYTTLGGYVFGQIGRLPKPGDRVTIGFGIADDRQPLRWDSPDSGLIPRSPVTALHGANRRARWWRARRRNRSRREGRSSALAAGGRPAQDSADDRVDSEA